MRKIDIEKDKLIVIDYLSGISLNLIKNKYNCSNKVISSCLKRNKVKRYRNQKGFKKNNKNRLTPEEEKKIIYLYKDEKISSIEIAKKIKRSKFAVLTCLKRNGCKRRTTSEACRKCELDETIFDNKMEEKALYWAGFLMADGNLFRKRENYTIKLGLSKKDREHVSKFKKFLGSSHALVEYKNLIQITVASKIIYEKLLDYGLTPNKSLTAKASSDVILNRHFWRGVIDGDGSIFFDKRNNNPHLTLCGSKFMIDDFIKYVKNVLNKDIKRYKHKNIFSATLNGVKDVSNILRDIYKDSNIFLNRKQILAMSILKERLV